MVEPLQERGNDQRSNGTGGRKGDRLESAGANTAKDAEAERSKLRAALDQANTEIGRLRTEIEQQKAIPSEQGNSVLQPPAE
jgi:hypothetical protein